jgi:hypothetical protein
LQQNRLAQALSGNADKSRVIRLLGVLAVLAILAMLSIALPVSASSGDTLVTTGSPSTPFPQNKQNEAGLAVDAHSTTVLAAGSNDELDLAPCVGSSCPFTPGVGVSGIYFSFDNGHSWTQPTYTGWSARTGTPKVGPIGTLPWYYERGLVSDGDPSLAIGPRMDARGHFSWANGSRLYYSNLTSNFSTVRSDQTFKGFEAIAVSRTDNLQTAAAGSKSAWMPPVIVSSRLSAVTFSDKENIWADNAASSRYFGNAYICWTSFRGVGLGSSPEPVVISRSTDGGSTWSAPKQLTAAANNRNGGRQGCTVRTDSTGVVYVFWEGAIQKHSVQFMARSFDGGISYERPRPVASVVDVGAFDPVSGDFTFDGVAGARTDSFPSVDIANGAPTGSGATNKIAMTWADARHGTPSPYACCPGFVNGEEALVQYSTDKGASWSTPINGAQVGDRPDFPAIAISPDGKNVYLTYDAFSVPWQSTTSAPRLMQGVVRHASSTLTGWSTLNRGASGDARGSSSNVGLLGEFLGDYNSAVATITYGAATWNDARNAADCHAVDVYRQSLLTSNPLPVPAPGTDCPASFGNTDVYGGSYAP